MLDWLTHDGQAYAAANLYVPLPAQVQQPAHTMLGQVTGLAERTSSADSDQERQPEP